MMNDNATLGIMVAMFADVIAPMGRQLLVAHDVRGGRLGTPAIAAASGPRSPRRFQPENDEAAMVTLTTRRDALGLGFAVAVLL